MSQTAEIPDMTATSGLCLFLYQAAFPANKMLFSASSKNFFFLENYQPSVGSLVVNAMGYTFEKTVQPPTLTQPAVKKLVERYYVLAEQTIRANSPLGW